MANKTFEEMLNNISEMERKENRVTFMGKEKSDILETLDFFLKSKVNGVHNEILGKNITPMVSLIVGKKVRNFLIDNPRSLVGRTIRKDCGNMIHQEAIERIVNMIPDEVYQIFEKDMNRAYEILNNDEKEQERVKLLIEKNNNKKKNTMIDSVRKNLTKNMKALDEEILIRMWREVQISKVMDSLKIFNKLK